MLSMSLVGTAIICVVYYWVRKSPQDDEATSQTAHPSCLARLQSLRLSWLPQVQKRSTWIWSASLLALMVALTVYYKAGLITRDLSSWACLVGATIVCSIGLLWRERVQGWLATLRVGKFSLAPIIELSMLVLGACLCVLVVELPSNTQLTSANSVGMLIEAVVCLLVLTFMHFVFQRHGIGAALGVVLLFLAGLVEYFVVAFRGEPLLASDVFAIGTAAAVGAAYTYNLAGSCVQAIALTMLTSTMFAFMPERMLKRRKAPRSRALRVVANCLVALIIVAGSAAALITVDLAESFGVSLSGWNGVNAYNRNGFLTSFLVGVQNIVPDQPEGYSTETAEELIASYAAAYDERTAEDDAYSQASAQFEELQPSVIVIMDESFSDLSIYDNLHAGYEGPEWYSSFDEAYLAGELYVSVLGGGTCNTEFEFLTGCSMAYVGTGVYPYVTYTLSNAPSLARQFKELGYTTTAIHPENAANWNRDMVYPKLGFDSFLDIGSFYNPEMFADHVSDAATFDLVLDSLTSSDEPQFIFTVTIQNHSPYPSSLISEEDVTSYYVDGTNDPGLDDYLARIDESDAALEELVEALSELDRPVVLVYFGDHQPSFATQYNDSIFADEGDTLEHTQRIYQSSYLVWANYDIAGAEDLLPTQTSATSANYLAAQVLELIGAPLTDYQKCILEIRESMPLINRIGYADIYGIWADESSSSSNAADLFYNDLWIAQYYELFGDEVS